MEKAAFAKEVENEYGWGKRRLQEFSTIGEFFDGKKRIISARRGAPKVEEMSVSTMAELSTIDDDVLIAAVDSGMFDKSVSRQELRTLSTEGKTPEQKQEEPEKTDLQNVRAMMDVAKKNIDA